MELRFKGIYKLVAVFFRKTMRARSDDEMQRLKELVESTPSAE
jgi:hypothetical protein